MDIIKFFKIMIKAAAYYLGIFKIFQIYYNRQGMVPIVLYHSIRDNLKTNSGLSAFALRNLIISKKAFARQISYLARHYNCISLCQYLDKRARGESLPNCAIITFDDGLKDFKDQALSILKANFCKATIFVIAGAKDEIHWKHALYTILDCAQKGAYKFTLKSGSEITISLESDKAKKATLLLLIDILGKIPDKERGDFLRNLSESLGGLDKDIFSNVYLNDADLVILSQAGVEIGAHSLRHEDLTSLDKEKCKEDIDLSLSYVRAITHKDNISFSAPFGRINDMAIDCLKAGKASAVLTGVEELNRKDEDIFRLKRLYISQDSLIEFIYKVSGAQMFFNKFNPRLIMGKKHG